MKILFPTFEVDEEVTHPHDPGCHGRVTGQNGGSVIVRWHSGDVESVGAFALDECRIGDK